MEKALKFVPYVIVGVIVWSAGASRLEGVLALLFVYIGQMGNAIGEDVVGLKLEMREALQATRNDLVDEIRRWSR